MLPDRFAFCAMPGWGMGLDGLMEWGKWKGDRISEEGDQIHSQWTLVQVGVMRTQDWYNNAQKWCIFWMKSCISLSLINTFAQLSWPHAQYLLIYFFVIFTRLPILHESFRALSSLSLSSARECASKKAPELTTERKPYKNTSKWWAIKV